LSLVSQSAAPAGRVPGPIFREPARGKPLEWSVNVRLTGWRPAFQAESVLPDRVKPGLQLNGTLIHWEPARLGVFMADLIHGRRFTPAGVETVRAIEDESRHVADIAVSMDDAGGNPDRRRIRRADDHDGPPAVGWAACARIPQV